jgi:hypothetical protein
MEPIYGIHRGSTREPGAKTRCTGKGSFTGQTGECMKASILMTRSMDLEFSFGQTRHVMKASGEMVSRKGKVLSTKTMVA